MRFGIVVGGDLGGIEAAARRAEEAGFESVWVAETARTAFLQAALAIRATSTVSVGTAVALAFPRSPAITAMTARDLAELSGGRFILGLGSQVKRVNEERFGVPFEHPAPKMGEYVEAVREVLGAFEGRTPQHEGRFYRITMAPFPGASGAGNIPIYLAAVNERMAEQAGRVADGISGHPMNSPEYLSKVVVPAIERGAQRAGRDPSEVSVTTNLITQISEDAEEAKRLAAVQLAFSATTVRTLRSSSCTGSRIALRHSAKRTPGGTSPRWRSWRCRWSTRSPSPERPTRCANASALTTGSPTGSSSAAHGSAAATPGARRTSNSC
jgi:probable F420-dependent oxidoreductase